MGGTIECLCHDIPIHNIQGKSWSIKVDAAECCNHSRKMVQIFYPNLDLPPIYGDHGCTSNEIASLVKRHLTDTPPTTQEMLDKMWIALQPLLMHCKSTEKMSRNQLICSRPPRMRKRYKRAFYLDLKPVHGTVNLFIKFEKRDTDDKAPRAIQYRASPYTARLAQFIVPLEKTLYQVIEGVNFGFPIIAKGLNARERGDLVKKMFDHYDKPVVYLIDHSKFDSCVNIDLLKLEHRFYNEVYKDKFLSFLLHQQLRNFGRSRNGIVYRCVGRRMSGDANTASGNCLINYAILRAKFGPKAIINLDGDDSIVFMPNEVEELDFTDCGMNSKVNIVYDIEQIEFCQSKPVLTESGYVMCRDPMRSLNRALYRLGKMPTNWQDYLQTIGIGEGMCSPYMPILQAYAQKFRSFGGEYKWYFSEYRQRDQNCREGIISPTITSRVGASLSFDIPCHQ